MTGSAARRGLWRRQGLRATTALALLLASVAPVLGQELRGLVILPDSVPAAGVTVELHEVRDTTGALADSTITGPAGQFGFSLRSEDPNTVFIVGARYGGVLYWGPPIHETDPDDLDGYLVAVFDTALVSAAVGSLRTTMRHIVITPASDGLGVEEIIDVEGMPGRTIVPDSDSVLVWIGALADDAHGVIPTQGGALPEDLAVGDGVIGFSGALPPSGVRIALQYVVPSSQYVFQPDHPTGRLEVLVMPRAGMEVEVAGLVEAPVGSDMRVPVRRFTAKDLPAGAIVSVRAVVEQPGTGRPWLWLLLSLGLGAAALASLKLTSRRS